MERRRVVGVAGVRIVAHGFTRVKSILRLFGSPLQRAKESFLSPVKTGSQNGTPSQDPTGKTGGLRFLRRLRRRVPSRLLLHPARYHSQLPQLLGILRRQRSLADAPRPV